MTEKQIVAFEFECVDLPPRAAGVAHLRLGIQEGKIVQDDAPCTGEAIRFAFSLSVSFDQERVAFSGAAAQGPSNDRFVYLCWGERINGAWKPHGRAKVKLGVLSRTQVEAALRERRSLRARIKMTGRRGEPVAASLKPESITWLE